MGIENLNNDFSKTFVTNIPHPLSTSIFQSKVYLVTLTTILFFLIVRKISSSYASYQSNIKNDPSIKNLTVKIQKLEIEKEDFAKNNIVLTNTVNENKNQIVDLSGRVERFKQGKKELDDENNNLKLKIQNLTKTLAEKEKKITELVNKVKELRNQKGEVENANYDLEEKNKKDKHKDKLETNNNAQVNDVYEQNNNNKISNKAESPEDEINECLKTLRNQEGKERILEHENALDKLMLDRMDSVTQEESFKNSYEKVNELLKKIEVQFPKYSLLALTQPNLVFEQLRGLLSKIATPYKEISDEQAKNVVQELDNISIHLKGLFPESNNGFVLQKQYLELTILACKKTIYPCVPSIIKTSKYFHGSILFDAIKALDWFTLPYEGNLNNNLSKLKDYYVSQTLSQAKGKNSANYWLIRPAAAGNSTEENNVFVVSTTDPEIAKVHEGKIIITKEIINGKDSYYVLEKTRFSSWQDLVFAWRKNFGSFLVEEPNGEARGRVFGGGIYGNGELSTDNVEKAFPSTQNTGYSTF